MPLQSNGLLLLSSLRDADPPNNSWFTEKSPTALAGRCLLDVLEYLRTDPKLPGRFRHVTNAHAIRLACRYLVDEHLDHKVVLDRFAHHIQDVTRRLRESRNDSPPYYGDDFWDWASVLEAFAEVLPHVPDKILDVKVFNSELFMFYEEVRAKVSEGLTIKEDGEWYGPATAAIAWRLIDQFRDRLGRDVEEVVDQLHSQALERIEHGEYRRRPVPPEQTLWHYGQIVRQFPKRETEEQAKAIRDLTVLDTREKDERVYALSRILQGSQKLADKKTTGKALSKLYECENSLRPLGQGVIGDNVKGSLNVLEALWPELSADQMKRIGAMIDALQQRHAAINTVGLVVAIGNEANAAKKMFSDAGAQVMSDTDGTTVIEHREYRVIMRQGKALVGVLDATRTLIDEYNSKWLIMIGVAGSLGREVQVPAGKPKFVGPDRGDVVVATALAPFRIYDKVREEIENAEVPFRGKTWRTIPTDPTLFCLAHVAAEDLFPNSVGYYEGLIVTGTGVKDALTVKDEILREFPSGLAVETESYVVGLISLNAEVPYLIIRGISDRAGGDKAKEKDTPAETEKQSRAANSAARLAVKVVELLSQRW
jgi:nucleoside phosphorylase